MIASLLRKGVGNAGIWMVDPADDSQAPNRTSFDIAAGTTWPQRPSKKLKPTS